MSPSDQTPILATSTPPRMAVWIVAATTPVTIGTARPQIRAKAIMSRARPRSIS